MAIKGSLKEASLPDVLQLLSMGKKTGCLSVTHRNNFVYIYFDKGRISYASVVNRRDRLGDMLVKSGAVTRRALEDAVAMQGRWREKRLGEILMDSGAITLTQLHGAIDIQIREAVYYLFTWNQGTFNFDADVVPDASEHVVSINPESLLLEGARRVDEWSLIEKKIPTFDIVCEVDRTKAMAAEVELTEEQTVVLELIDGRRDIQGLVDASGLGEFEVGKALYGLMTAGFVHKVGRTAASANETPENRADEHMNLGVAFYKTGMLDESLREFRRVVELRTGDRAPRFYIGLALSRQGKWTEAAAAFTDCTRETEPHPAVLHNLAYALEQQHRYDEARAALDEAISHGGGDDAKIHMSIGVLHFLGGDLAAATTSLRTARPLFGKRAPTPAWFHYAALAAALSGDADSAVAILTDGVTAHPHAAILLNNLAVVLERRGDSDAALATAERALNEDASIAQLHKNLGDLRYRAARYDDALESYLRATKMNPDLGADVYLRIGNIRLRRQERVEAMRCWERALELDPSNAIVRTNLESVRQVF